MKTSKESFEIEMLKAVSSIEKIKLSLSKFETDFNEKGNWSYVGSLCHVNELLDEINEFLG